MELAEIFSLIKKYQQELGYDFDTMTYARRIEVFRHLVLAMQVEQVELLNETPWKPWRPIDDQKEGTAEVIADEWVDCLFFLVDQALCLGLTAEDAMVAFKHKMVVNRTRIATGYNKRKKEKTL